MHASSELLGKQQSLSEAYNKSYNKACNEDYSGVYLLGR